jgi:subtilisin family serine protease
MSGKLVVADGWGVDMSSLWEKIDAPLASIYADYLRGSRSGESERVNVSVQHTAGLLELEAHGFVPGWIESEDRAAGAIDLARLEELAELPGVNRILVGRPPRKMLDVSVPDIRANRVWTLAGSIFTGETGAAAIVGVIDTGIDFRHPFFLRSRGPDVTRIKRIWDPGLVPRGGETSPDVALLGGALHTYGVEYTDAHINDVLQGVVGARPVRHRDCGGHGTHVASIAAGDGQTALTHIGVAPGADIVVVKIADFATDPVAGGVPVQFSQLFKDAVNYARNAAGLLGKPLAINYSFGSDIGPHDGFTDEEDFLFDTFVGAGSTGKIFVQAAGNAAGSRAHARIEFPAGGGTVEIPIDLNDPRTNRREFDSCSWKNNTQDLFLDVWYPRGPATLTGALDLPHDAGGFFAGPALDGAATTRTFGGRVLKIFHSRETQVLRHARGVADRNEFLVQVTPFRNRHRTGRYVLRLTSSGALIAHLWCHQASLHGFEVAGPPAVIPPNVFVVDDVLIGDNAGAGNTVTVAAYNAESAPHEVVFFSSRGPLVRYGGAPAPPAKPDIAAPGMSIDAAKSRDVRPVPPPPGPLTSMSGTSMASPHVTGAVALMLAKNPALTVADVLAFLRGGVRPVVPPIVPATADEAGAGRADVKASFDLTP